MNTKKKFNLSVIIAIYGFVSAIAFPIIMGLREGFDSTVPDSAIIFIAIAFDIAKGTINTIEVIVINKLCTAA